MPLVDTIKNTGWVGQLRRLLGLVGLSTLLVALASTPLLAQSVPQIEIENPRGDSFGVEGAIPGSPPPEGAVIVTPGNGQNFTDMPITVSGMCPTGVIVRILINDVMAGSVLCQNGSFSLQVSLFPGQNDIVAYVYDNLDQVGPASNTVSVTFNNVNFAPFGTLITLTSNYHRRAANPGETLVWPLILSGGTGPYAFSIDWGDNTEPDLQSQPVAGNVNISHVYKNPGVYNVIVRVTDVNGVTAFLQLVAVANGAPTAGVTIEPEADPDSLADRIKILWQPALAALVLMIPTFWLGGRYQLAQLRKEIERDAAAYRTE